MFGCEVNGVVRGQGKRKVLNVNSLNGVLRVQHFYLFILLFNVSARFSSFQEFGTFGYGVHAHCTQHQLSSNHQ